ncbi:MAG: tetratricopeptide repeat protein, partial [Acidobacteria bacterium]|nr:tetratricopeptide repeat protein [Acidobacteriota bacterium]
WKRGNCLQGGDHLRKAMEGSPPVIWRALYIECLEKNGQQEEAERQSRLLGSSFAAGTAKFEKLERPKDNYDGASFRQLRRLVQLQEELKHAKLPMPEHAARHFHEALEYLKDGMERQAVDELEMVIEFDPENFRAYLEMGAIHLKAGRLEEAVKSANRALEWENTPEGYVLLARIYLAQGNTVQAQATLDDAMRLDPANTAAASLRDEMTARTKSR